MKHKLPVFAILVVSSQLALAEAANDPVFTAQGPVAEHMQPNVSDDVSALDAEQEQGWGDAITHPDLSSMTPDVAGDLQEKLDATMHFDLVPRDPSDPEFAGTH